MSRDTWQGDYNRPLSLNRWNYGYGNPVKYTDPTGRFPVECLEADNVAQCLQDFIRGGGDCDDLCPEPPKVTNSGPVHQAYKALLETPCERRNGKLYPWWKSKGALQKTYAPMDMTMLIAVLVYTEASPLSPGELNLDKLMNKEEARNVWIKTAANRLSYQCTETGECNIGQEGATLGYGLSQFLAWSHHFAYADTNYKADPKSLEFIGNEGYGAPTWAYTMAQKVVMGKGTYNLNRPYGAMNTQTLAEQKHFLGAYDKFGKFSTDPEGVYYMWGRNDGEITGDMVVLTWNQQKYHCGSGKFPCGN